jgi:ribosomal protein L2
MINGIYVRNWKRAIHKIHQKSYALPPIQFGLLVFLCVCILLANIPIGTWVHNIEWDPSQGTKLIRVAQTFAQIIKKFENTPQCVVHLPSDVDKLMDFQCQATIGIMFNLRHGKHKLHKTRQNRWLSRCPIVRGVAMNLVDHPHGGGEGCMKGGRPSVSPWGKPSKGGFKTIVIK